MKNPLRTSSRTRRSGRNRAFGVAALAMPQRIVPLLGMAVVGLIVVYVVLMVTTIFFATLQTKLAQDMQDTQASIERLEAQYYAAIAKIDATDPHAAGLVAPRTITYVSAASVAGLSFATPEATARR